MVQTGVPSRLDRADAMVQGGTNGFPKNSQMLVPGTSTQRENFAEQIQDRNVYARSTAFDSDGLAASCIAESASRTRNAAQPLPVDLAFQDGWQPGIRGGASKTIAVLAL